MKTIEERYQSCLGNGRHTLHCSELYSAELNKLLVRTNNVLHENTDAAARKDLKENQHEWLQEKEVYFRGLKRESAADNTDILSGNDS